MNNKFFKSIIIISIIFLSQCAKKKPNHYLAKNYYEQSLVESEEKNFNKAIQLINQSIEISPTPKALAHKASLFYQINNFTESMNILQKLIKEKNIPVTLKADINNNLACTYLALGDKETAKKIWQNLTTNENYISPEVAWYMLGIIEYNDFLENYNKIDFEINKQHLKEAQFFFNKAIDISSEFVDAYYYLAKTVAYMHDYQKAKGIIKSLLEIEPDHEPAKELMAQMNDNESLS